MITTLNDSRYRPALLALAGISTAYAIYLIRQRYIVPQQTSEPQTHLRRRNAIHRHDAPRRRRTRSSPREVGSIEVSEQAIAALRTRDENGRPYGFLDIHSIEHEIGQDTGRRRETQWPLLPGMLPTAHQFQTQEGTNAEDAQGLRQHAELMFMDAFLVNQYPPSHTIAPLETTYLVEQLSDMGIGSSVILQCIERFNTDPNFGSEMRQDHAGAQNPPFFDGATDFQRMGNLLQALDGAETTVDDHSNFDWREGNGDTSSNREGQNTLNLLYNIAADQARRDGYIHRGVECNGCGIMPIQGIRYRCANCLDFDLCDSCEAQELHIKTHVFYKIRVPAPSLGALGNSRQGLPVWYPGKPGAMPRSLPRELSSRLLHESGFENSELDALWDQFRCLAGTEWSKDPNKLGMAIDRKTFDKCFVPPLSIRPPPPNLIYDRMFAFYDTNKDGLIGFEEFLKGLASLNDKSREGRLRRIFQGYDMDNDGYVDRKDFLRMFRAFYTLSKELNREMVAGMEEDLIEGGARDIVHGSQPISSAFPGSIPIGHASQGGVGKELDANGDLAIIDNRGILDDDRQDVSDRHQLIADIATRYQRRSPELQALGHQAQTDDSLPGPRQVVGSTSNVHPANSHDTFGENRALDDDDPSLIYHYSWPPVGVQSVDIVNALGSEVPLPEIMDQVDRSRVSFAQSERVDAEWQADTEQRRHNAVQERWRRRRFYTDLEEGGSAPQGYTEIDSSDDEADATEDAIDSVTSASASRPLSPRSRSSSKVRFEDSVTDTDYETRSNTSSRSIPVGERWGGYDISEIEKDAGKEILYQAVQQGFNELLDQLFKEKEDLTMEAHQTRKMRRKHAKEIQAFSESLNKKPDTAVSDSERTKRKAIPVEFGSNHQTRPKDVERDTLLEEAGYSIEEPTSDPDPEPVPSRTIPPRPPPDHPIYHGVQSYGFTMRDYVAPAPILTVNSSHDQDQDSTMPQFRPNEPGTNAPLPTTDSSAASLNSSHVKHPISPNNAESTSSSFPLTHDILTTYLRHNALETEARARGGFGRLDYGEFKRGMVGDEAAGGDGGKGGGGEREKGKKWGNGGGMGRLGFVGSWIEMASF
jgi:hypothetical protein